MNENGFIKIYRKILNWEWSKKPNTVALWLYCLIKANWTNGKFEGHEIPRGSFVTSLKSLSKETGLTMQQTKTSLNHLISTRCITNKSYSKYRVITVINYDLYQDINKDINKQLTNNQQTTNNNIRNKEYKKRESVERSFTSPPPTLSELRSYCYENNMEDFDYEYFYNYYEATEWIDKNGNQIKNWKNKLRNWYKRDEEKGRLKMPEDSRRLG